jgi:hypothetical protein
MLNTVRSCCTTTVALAIVVALGLSACAGSTVNVTVIERQGTAIANGTVDASRNSGTMRLSFPTKTYEGPWTAVRTSGGETHLLHQYGLIGGIPIAQTAALTSDSASGIGMANLIATDGDQLRCEFRYSMVGFNISGIGVCRDAGGRIYDMQMAN